MEDHWWRVAPVVASAKEGESGHPKHVAVEYQRAGRWDNKDFYTAGYISASPEGAVGEVLGGWPVWEDRLLLPPPYIPGSVRSLVEFRATPGLRLLDLDDARVLVKYKVRPSGVVRRNRDDTNALGLRLFDDLRGEYDGLQWWSYWRPEWTNAMIWREHESDGTPQSPFAAFVVESVVELSLDLPAVVSAARVLPRLIEVEENNS